MCIGCHWANFRDYIVVSSAEAGGPTAALASSFVAEAIAAEDGSADIVFKNGPVYTVDSAKPWADAVAVKGRRIAYVGDEAGVHAFVGPQTRVVDLAGKLLLPGFVEGHTHPLVGATVTRGVDLQFDTRQEILEALRAYRDKIGSASIVRGFGWRYGAFPSSGPRKEDLDAIWPETPVFLIAIDAHGAWVNSKALALAGIGKGAPDPLPGFSVFQRDPTTDEPTGYLVEVPAMMRVNNAVEPFSSDYVAESLAAWLPKAAEAGITTVYDAGMQVVPEVEGFAIYDRLEREGRLPFRVIGSYYYNQPAIDPVPVIQALNRAFNSELVKASVLKLNIDGGEAQRTGAFLAPYADAPETRGDTLLPPEQFADIIRRADREGLDIHIHAYGDRGARLSLDAFEAAINANPPRDRRHTLCHLFLVAAEDLPRFAKLGVIAQFSTQWAVPDQHWRKISQVRLGAERSNEQYRFGSIQRAGGVLSFGTDWPAAGYHSTYRPLDAIEVATTRRELDKPDGPQLPPVDEVITLDAALKANTMGAAFQLRMDRDVGSIETGKLADLVVLERNLFDVASHDVHKTKILMTVMNGKVTHEAPA